MTAVPYIIPIHICISCIICIYMQYVQYILHIYSIHIHTTSIRIRIPIHYSRSTRICHCWTLKSHVLNFFLLRCVCVTWASWMIQIMIKIGSRHHPGQGWLSISPSKLIHLSLHKGWRGAPVGIGMAVDFSSGSAGPNSLSLSHVWFRCATCFCYSTFLP